MFFQHCLTGFDAIQCRILSGVHRETHLTHLATDVTASREKDQKGGKRQLATLTNTRTPLSAKTALLKSISHWFLFNPLLFNSHCPCKFSHHRTDNGLRFYGRSVASFGGSHSLSLCSSQSNHSCKCFGLIKILDLQCQTTF